MKGGMIRRMIEKCGRERQEQDPVTEQSGLSLHVRRPQKCMTRTPTEPRRRRGSRKHALPIQRRPFSIIFSTKSVFNCYWLFRGFLSYLQESPLKLVRLLTTYVCIYIYIYIFWRSLHQQWITQACLCSESFQFVWPLFLSSSSK